MKPKYELDNVISWMKTATRCLGETDDALQDLKDLERYGHYTLDVTVGGSTTGEWGNDYQKMKVTLDFLEMTNNEMRDGKVQKPLFDCLCRYLTEQQTRYKKQIAEYRRIIKEVA